MMLQARQHNEEPHRICFYEPFNSEQESRIKHNVQIIGSPVFEKGLLTTVSATTNNCVGYKDVFPIGTPHSIVIRWRINELLTGFRYICAIKDPAGANRVILRIDNATDFINVAAAGYDAIYENGVVFVANQVVEVGKWYETVLVDNVGDYKGVDMYLGGHNAIQIVNCSVDYAKIYNYALTASEVANLYSG